MRNAFTSRFFSRKLATNLPRKRKPFLGVESLEERTVPTVFPVNNTSDTGGGSLRQAIIDLNSMGEVDSNSITFLPGLFGTIPVTSANLPTITKNVDIVGPSASLIKVDGGDTKSLFRFDDALAGALTVSISGLTITKGLSALGGGITNQNENLTIRDVVIFDNQSTGNGGGILANGGMVTLVNSQVTSNRAVDGAGIRNIGATFIVMGSQIDGNVASSSVGTGGYFQSAGALQDLTNSTVSNNLGGLGAGLFITGGPATIVDSQISNNRATNTAASNGGGIAIAGGAVVLKNATVSGNVANGSGGGVRFTAGSLEIHNSTIAFNKADNDNATDGLGGGLFATAGNVPKLISTIVAKNVLGTFGTNTDVSAVVDATSNKNLIGINTGLTGISNGTLGNLIGTTGTPRDPQLLPLAFNGGFSKTHAIMPTSDAKDAGDATVLALTNDGRGAPFARQVGTKVDIGAYELTAGPISLVVTTAADENDATFDAASLSVREAVRLAGTDAATITFAPALNGQTLQLKRGRIFIDRPVTLTGPGSSQFTIDGGNTFQLFEVNDNNSGAVSVAVTGLTLTNGKADPNTGGEQFGGGMRTFENVTIDDVTISNCVATSDSGGIDHQNGTLTVRNSTITGNRAGTVAGGIGNFGTGTVSVINSTVSNNTANGTNGGGLFNQSSGTIIVTASTISGNTAKVNGGGIHMNDGNLVVMNSTISGNQAKNNGGGVHSLAGTVSINNSTVAFNKADSDNAGGGFGGGLFIAAAVTPSKMVGTIVAKNEVGTTGSKIDISGRIDGKNSLVFSTTGWDQTGSSANKLGLDPLLGVLALNGGTTKTHAITTGPAVDPGFADASINPDALTNDQIGTARKIGASIDIGSFEFTPNTAPTITDVTDQMAAVGTATAAIPFTVGDTESLPAALVVTATSSDLTVVANAGIVIGGMGTANQTVTITGLAAGTTTITLIVTDAGGLTATDTFVVTVTEAVLNTPPTITDVTDQMAVVGTATAAIPFTIGDAEDLPAVLTVTATSSDQTIVADAGIVISGTGANRTLKITGLAVGTTTITLTVTDAGGMTATDTFDVTTTAGVANTPPTISNVGNQSTVLGTSTAAIPFTVGDTQTAPAALVVTRTSSNLAVVANAGIVIGGTGANRTVTITGLAVGTTTITLTVTDAGGLTATDTFVVTINAVPVVPTVKPVLVGFPQFGVGADAGGGSATLFNADKSVQFTVTPFAGFTGGVRTATADFNGDGVADLIVGTGPGIATQVIVFDGKTQGVLFSVAPFEASFVGGVYISAGDVTGDGIPDLAITPDEGGGPRVDIYSGAAGFPKVTGFFGIDDTNFRGGARSAIADMNGDGTADLIVVAGFGGGPRVAAFNGKSLATTTPVKIIGDFFAFEQTLRNGIFVTAGDINGDGFADLIAGGGPGGGPRVLALDGKSLLNNEYVNLANFFGGDVNSRGGIRVAVKNLDGDTKADLVVGSGAGAGSRVTTYLGKNIGTGGTPAAQFDFDAISGFTGGVFVG